MSRAAVAATLALVALASMIVAPANVEGIYGQASYYGSESGSVTASGQRFNPEELTAAHRRLRFGTRCRIQRGERSVVVTITDRGPFITGRVIDLSKGAARALGMLEAGVAHIVAECSQGRRHWPLPSLGVSSLIRVRTY